MFSQWGEKIGEFLAGEIEGLVLAAWFFIEDAFAVGTVNTADGDGRLSDWWVAVVGGEITQVSTDGTVMSTVDHPGLLGIVTAVMLPVLIILALVQVCLSAFRGSTEGMLRAGLMAIAGVPVVWIMAGLVWVCLGITDTVTNWILTTGTSQNDGVVAVLSLFGLQWDESGANTADGAAGVVLNENFVQWEMARAEGDARRTLFPLIVAVVMMLCGAVLMFFNVLRVLVILLLTVFLPVAVFSMTSQASKPIFSRWCAIVAALLAAKPAAAVVMRFGAVIAQTGSEWIMMVCGVVLILVAAAAPFIMLALMSWMTGGSSDGIERAGAAAGQKAVHQTKRAVNSTVQRASIATRGISRAGRGGGTVKPVGGSPAPGGAGGGGAAAVREPLGKAAPMMQRRRAPQSTAAGTPGGSASSTGSRSGPRTVGGGPG
ncbi:hypothetical protein [Nesterenkonia sp. K-15-9-6]|uniref:hypothetical protein n=1 Tax=Nesterenkonia sp. K-15-9-6 TaxID=3093918 RepID=UPI004044BF98